jgi:hypothetical protein
MKFKLLLTTTLFASALAGNAQNRNVAYAITGDGNKDFMWMNIRQVDLNTGAVTKTLFERSKTNFVLTDVNSNVSSNQETAGKVNIFSDKSYPTATFVAAAAMDNKSNKLFFSPMRLSELRWLELSGNNKTPQFYSMESSVLKFGDMNDEANHLTRMVIGADGNGYAMTNDGNHLIRFTTGKLPVLTDLGNIVDADNSGAVSIHNKCTSWGGDMIADAFGKLYVISANKHVFEIDIATRIATHKGQITGTPAVYTANAAAVNADGDIIITSANYFEGYYVVKLADLTATKLEGSDAKYNASDLACGNLLLEKEAAKANQLATVTPNLKRVLTAASSSKVFPNPVTSSSFNILLDGQKDGRYTVSLSDLQGRVLQTKSFTVIKSAQTEQVTLVNRPVKGVYMVKVMNAKNQVVITEKIIVE